MNTSLLTTDLRDLPRRILPAYGTSKATLLSIAPFLALTRELGALLVPMRPHPAFRAELHRSLIADARRQQAQATLAIAPPPADSALGSGLPDRMAHLLALPPDGDERRWAVGAAAVGGAVSLGILAYLLRHRDPDGRGGLTSASPGVGRPKSPKTSEGIVQPMPTQASW